MNNLKKAYELGWIQASKWAEREDLIADIGSPTYVREADAALADQQPQAAIKQPQAEPLESLLSTDEEWAKVMDDYYKQQQAKKK